MREGAAGRRQVHRPHRRQGHRPRRRRRHGHRLCRRRRRSRERRRGGAKTRATEGRRYIPNILLLLLSYGWKQYQATPFRFVLPHNYSPMFIK
jgi:hypothetical protein